MPFRTNLALYQTAYHDIQVQEIGAQCDRGHHHRRRRLHPGGLNANQCSNNFNDNITLNARKARIYGAEWDVTVMPTDWLTLNSSGSYIDPRYTDFNFMPPPGYLLPTNNQSVGHAHPRATLADQRNCHGQFWRSGNAASHWATCCSQRIIIGRAAIWRNMTGFDPAQRTFAYGLLNLRLDFTDVGQERRRLGLLHEQCRQYPGLFAGI